MQLAESIAAVAAEDVELQNDLAILDTNVANVQAEINQQGQDISALQDQVAALIAAGDGATDAQLAALSTIATDLGASHQRIAETNATLAAMLPQPVAPPVVVDPPAPTGDTGTTDAPVGGDTGPVNPDPGTPVDPTTTNADPKVGFVLKVAGETYNEYVDRAAAAGFTSVLELNDWNAVEVGATYTPPAPEVVPTAETGA